MNSPTPKRTATDGLQRIIHAQHADGSYAITTRPGEAPAPLGVNLLLHAQLLDALRTLDKPQLADSTRALAGYLLSTLQHAEQGMSFAGIDTNAVFHTAASLYEYDPTLIDAAMTAQLIRHLIAHEVEPGGPYRNALDKPSAAPDLAANVSISRFIHYIGGPFPKLTSYIERQTAARPPTDRYASAWPQESMPTLRVTLQLVKQRPEANHPTPDRQLADQQFRDEYDTILSNAHQYITGLDQLVGESIAAMLRRIIKADANYEIGTLAVRFASSVISPRAVPKTTLQMLGGANLYNWVAYTIYDDFLDDEGTPQLLSTANIALRRAISLFNQAVPSDTFKQLVAEMFDIIDTANAWEVANCRFAVKHGSITIGALPDYTNLDRLYQRSLSHSLPALGVLLHAGAPAEAVTCVRSAFQEYLIIRQLSDDLHDWQDDLRMGRITYIVAQLLADAAITSGPKRLTSLIARLENTFWHHTLASISKQVNTHAMRARTLLAESGILESPNVIGQLAQGIEDNMARTLAEQHTANQFLVAYRVTTPVHPKIHSEAM